MSWEKVKATLKRVTIADDMQKQMAALQLMMGQQLSGTSGLSALGFDWKSEQKRIADEARVQQELQAKQQEEMEQAGFAAEIAKGQAGQQQAQGAQGGGAGGGGGQNPAGPDAQSAMAAMPVDTYIQSMGPNAMTTPEELQAAAGQLAQELLGLPEGVKDSQLRTLKKFNPTLHSIVRSKLDEIRSQLKTQGGAALQAQQFGGGGGAVQ
jgi:hypothetical protein